MPTKNNHPLQDSELPLETVLNPGLLKLKDCTFTPVELLIEKMEEADPSPFA